MVRFAVELDQLDLEVLARRPQDLLHPCEVPVGEHLVPVPGHKDQVSVQEERTMPTCADVAILANRPT